MHVVIIVCYSINQFAGGQVGHSLSPFLLGHVHAFILNLAENRSLAVARLKVTVILSG